MKEDNKASVKVTNALAKEIREQFDFRDVLCLCQSSFGIFNDFSRYAKLRIIPQKPDYSFANEGNTIIGDPFVLLDNLEDSYDLIVGDLPLGLNNSKWDYEPKNISIRTRKNWIILFKSLLKLKEDGFGLFLVEPSFWSKRWQDFVSKLNEQDFFIFSVINPPERILAPEASIQPNLVLISRKQADQIFLVELEDTESIELQIKNLKAGKNTNSLAEGVFVNSGEFRDFYNFKINSQISKLKTQYKEYSSYRLSDISIETNTGRNKQQFKEIKNSIYVPRRGNLPITACLEELTLKHQHYFQVILDDTILNNKYLELFFSSEMGQLVLKSLYSGSVVPFISKLDLMNVLIPIPPLKEQRQIVGTSNELFRLKAKIEDFKRELSLNPRNANRIRVKVIDLFEQLDLLSDRDRVLTLIRRGESKTLEFKQTLSIDIEKNTKEKYIEKAALKTIVGFLNTEGGILLIGVSDDGKVVGLQSDFVRYDNNLDKFLLHFKNLVKSQVGEDFYPDIDYRLIEINGMYVLFIKCNASSKPCFLNRKDFYVRTNPATDLLEGPRLIDYIDRRFGE